MSDDEPELRMTSRLIGISNVERRLYRNFRKTHDRSSVNWIMAGLHAPDVATLMEYGALVRRVAALIQAEDTP